jgi:putative membrane protein
MYTRRNIRWRVIFHFAWWQVIVFSMWSIIVVLLYLRFDESGVNCSLPIAPLGTIGIAVAFYVGFKNSQSYDRYWEARKIWGGIVNVSRSWANLVMSFVTDAHNDEPVAAETVDKTRRALINRHLAWINSLRFQLRRKTPWGFQPKGLPKKLLQPTDIAALRRQVTKLLPQSELEVICSRANSATHLLRMQGEQLRQISEQKPRLIEEFRLIAMMDLITEMYALQGKCERIKNTPFPRQYAYFSGLFVWIFVVLLPFGIVGELASRGGPMIWMTVPMSVIISWIFYTMESVGDASEDPFENFINDVPMTALCRTIEIDLLQMLGEEEVPEPILPVNDILM